MALPPPAYHTLPFLPLLPPPPTPPPPWALSPITQLVAPPATQLAPPAYVAPPARPAQPAPGPAAAQAAPQRGAPGPKSFVGWPASADIIGSLSTYAPGANHSTQCKVCRQAHSMWECPIRYHSILGAPCPGFLAGGARDLAAWSGGELTPAARLAWLAYGAAHHLVVARSAPPGVPAF